MVPVNGRDRHINTDVMHKQYCSEHGICVVTGIFRGCSVRREMCLLQPVTSIQRRVLEEAGHRMWFWRRFEFDMWRQLKRVFLTYGNINKYKETYNSTIYNQATENKPLLLVSEARWVSGRKLRLDCFVCHAQKLSFYPLCYLPPDIFWLYIHFSKAFLNSHLGYIYMHL